MDWKEKVETAAKATGLITAIFLGSKWIFTKLISPLIKGYKYVRSVMKGLHPDSIETLDKKVSEITKDLADGRKEVMELMAQVDFNREILMATNSDQAFWYSENGLCIYASAGLQRLIDRPEDDILGNNWSAWIVENNAVYEAYMASVQRLATFNMPYTFIRRDGKYQKVQGMAKHKKFGERTLSYGWLKAIGEPYVP